MSPALPWASGTSGTITLGTAVTDEQILAGDLVFTAVVNGEEMMLDALLSSSVIKFTVHNEPQMVVFTKQRNEGAYTSFALTADPDFEEDASLVSVAYAQRHDIEIWADQACTTRPNGEVTSVYVQFNRSYGFDQAQEFGNYEEPGGALLISTPSTEYPTDYYGVYVYVDFFSPSQNTPFSVGQVVKCTTDGGTGGTGVSVDVTGFQFSFGDII